MKREASPQTPYKRKAKGKETSPGFYENPLSPRGRVRTRESLSRYRLAGAAAEELIAILGAEPSNWNRRNWAGYCYYHDIETILDKAHEFASCQRQGEIRNAVTRFQRWLCDTYGEDVR